MRGGITGRGGWYDERSATPEAERVTRVVRGGVYGRPPCDEIEAVGAGIVISAGTNCVGGAGEAFACGPDAGAYVSGETVCVDGPP